MQSIEDLISESAGGDVDEESSQGKLVKRQASIKANEIERHTESQAQAAGVSYINLHGFPISQEALALIKEEEARKLSYVCFFYDGEHLKIATTELRNSAMLDSVNKLNEKLHTKISIYLVSEQSLGYALKLYASLPKFKKIIRGVEIAEEDIAKFKNSIKDYKSLNEKINEVNTTDVVTLILATAMKTNASDVHIEAEEGGIVIRLRIDGVLQEAAVVEKEKWKKIISRMKLLAKVKINIQDKPQDGRFTIFLDNNKIDVRTSFLPTSFGESVVMRLLRSDSVALGFDKLGIAQGSFEILEKEIKKPNGLILTTGPTGSGKTTTLYSVINKLNTEDTKIITLEDPIEYQLEGVNQSQIDERKGYTFAKGLRSILRQDPDIVMVGEIRDLETAEISVQASLTGHLVLSTLHTNDAAGVVPRLVDMGVKPYFLTPSINAIIGQRLVRKLCEKCRLPHEVTSEEEETVRKILAVISPKAEIEIPSDLGGLYKKGEGCEHCSGIGYKGRIGIYEIFTMSDNIKALTSEGAPAFKILELAIQNGMITMLQDGVLKCLKGITTLEEIYRVIGKFDYVDTLYDIVMSKTIGRGIKVGQEEIDKAKQLISDLTKAEEAISSTSSKKMTEIIMALAVETSTGDIHIEPTEGGVKVRFRIDGILHDIADLSKDSYIQILSKIKTVAGFATNVKKAVMDGRFSIFIGERKVDCRLSVISGGYGETIVIRILSSEASDLKMEELGIKSQALSKIQKALSKTKGIIITTGPTGSGKTTTLYSALNQLNNEDTKIITIEDPIEYHLDGIMQTQIDKEAGYTFASAIRSLMRQNPNIIMVGEIRDNETAKVAIEAAMTGHLVLSTVHSNSAAGAISRLAGLGVERQALASSIECAIGQRLVRKICPHCIKEKNIEDNLLSEIKEILSQINPAAAISVPDDLKFYEGAGCDKCNGLGFKGRLGIYEAITMTSDMQKLIQKQDITNFDIEQSAMEAGTILMIQDGILKALEGLTTVEEVLRVAR